MPDAGSPPPLEVGVAEQAAVEKGCSRLLTYPTPLYGVVIPELFRRTRGNAVYERTSAWAVPFWLGDSVDVQPIPSRPHMYMCMCVSLHHSHTHTRTQGLAKSIAWDGEGATCLMEVEVTGAKSDEDARVAAKSVVGSSLVKSAIFGNDPNWGRIAAAAGYSGKGLSTCVRSCSLVLFLCMLSVCYIQHQHVVPDGTPAWRVFIK